MFRRHDPLTHDGQAGCIVPDGLRDAEVQQLRDTLVGYENVGGFQIAVNDQVLMRILHCIANLYEQLDALVDRQKVAVAILVDARPADVLHDEVGRAVVVLAAVQQAGNVAMVEVGQDLPLAPEAFAEPLAEPGTADDLDRDPLFVGLVVASRQVNRAHAALCDLVDNAPRTDSFATPG